MDIDLEALGFTQEELQDRVIDRIVARLLEREGWADEGWRESQDTPFFSELNDRMQRMVKKTIEERFEAEVLPVVQAGIEGLIIQETNQWGEKKGEPVSFIEYLTGQAEAYLTVLVDYNGKAKGSDSFGWTGKQTRLTHMVHEHLHYSIDTAMKDAVNTVQKSLAVALEKTVKLKLDEISKTLQVSIKTAR